MRATRSSPYRLISFISFLLSVRFFFFFASPDEETAERRRRPGACVAPVTARHDRRADLEITQIGTSPIYAEARTRRRDARLSTLHRGDFWPGPVLPVVRDSLQDDMATSFATPAIVTRRTGSREPPYFQTARSLAASGDATASLRLSERLRWRPS